MNPAFGSIVWDHIYSPMTDDVKQALVDDVTQIVNSDPRTTVSNVILSEYELGIQIEIEIYYNQFNQSEQLLLAFNGESNTVQISNR